MDLRSIHSGVCCFDVPFPQHTPASHSSLILGVFCWMTNEGFWEDFLLPTLNNSDREKENSLVIFLSHGPRLVHLVMSHEDKAPLSAGEKVSQVTESTNLVDVFKRQPETKTECSLLLFPFLHFDIIFSSCLMCFTFLSLFLHLPCSSLRLATLWSISSLKFLTHGQQPLYLMILYDFSNDFTVTRIHRCKISQKLVWSNMISEEIKQMEDEQHHQLIVLV